MLLDYDKQKEIWAEGNFRTHIKLAADHYKIFHDLYEYGYFFPTTVLNVCAAVIITEDKYIIFYYVNK